MDVFRPGSAPIDGIPVINGFKCLPCERALTHRCSKDYMNIVLFTRIVEIFKRPTIRTILLVLLAISSLVSGWTWKIAFNVSEKLGIAVTTGCLGSIALTGSMVPCVVVAIYSLLISISVSVSNEEGSPVKRDLIYGEHDIKFLVNNITFNQTGLYRRDNEWEGVTAYWQDLAGYSVQINAEDAQQFAMDMYDAVDNYPSQLCSTLEDDNYNENFNIGWTLSSTEYNWEVIEPPCGYRDS
ncbi:hypothetical protein V1522DRAFT_453840 [Lipomyces starkeyi]